MEKLSVQVLPGAQLALAPLIDPVYIVDTQFNLLWVNGAFRQAFGYRPRHRLPCHTVTKMGICGAESCLLRAACSQGTQTKFVETDVGGALESDASCSAIGLPIYDNDGQNVIAAIGVLRDMSVEVRLHKKYAVMLEAERNRKELLEKMVAERTADLVATNDRLALTNRDLDRSRKEVADILANIRQAIFTIDDKQRIGREYSAFAEELFGQSALAGRDFVEFIAAQPERERDRKELAEWLKLVFHSPTLDWNAAKGMVQSEYQYLRTDGERRELLADFEAIREEDNRVKRVMVIISDLTEKRNLERHLSKKQQEIDENIEHLSELAKLDPEMYELFFEEAFEIIEGATKALAEIKSQTDPGQSINKMFRDMHTLKGNAMSYGLVRVAAKAHWVEDAFSDLRESVSELSEATIRDTTEKVDELRDLFVRIQSMASRVLSGKKPPDTGAVRSADRPLKHEIEQERLSELIEWIDRAHQTVGAEKMLDELRLRVRGLVLVPMSRLYRRFPKMVNDLAEQLGKNVNPVELEGADLALTGKVFNELAGAAVHLLRNCIDHGIETPDRRLAANKASHGTVRVLSAFDAESFRIVISDDGAGIDPQVLVRKAKEKGILPADAAPSREEALKILFESGFSTAEQVTDVSGRGVGMDAVRDTVESLGGSVSIETELGQGTRFVMTVPRAVALGE